MISRNPLCRSTDISPKYDSLILVGMESVQVEFGGGRVVG